MSTTKGHRQLQSSQPDSLHPTGTSTQCALHMCVCVCERENPPHTSVPFRKSRLPTSVVAMAKSSWKQAGCPQKLKENRSTSSVTRRSSVFTALPSGSSRESNSDGVGATRTSVSRTRTTTTSLPAVGVGPGSAEEEGGLGGAEGLGSADTLAVEGAGPRPVDGGACSELLAGSGPEVPSALIPVLGVGSGAPASDNRANVP